jgi:hypothetical protein
VKQPDPERCGKVDSMRHDGYLVGILLSSIHEISALMGENDAQEVSKQAFRDYVTTSDNTSGYNKNSGFNI